MKLDATIVLIALAGSLGLAGGYYYGEGAGRKAEAGKRDATTVQQLRDVLCAHAGLVKQSSNASRAMRTALATRQSHDEKTSKDFRDALTSTTDTRAGCVFPADVMQQLAAARGRAAEAAALGVRGALPSTDATADQQPR